MAKYYSPDDDDNEKGGGGGRGFQPPPQFVFGAFGTAIALFIAAIILFKCVISVPAGYIGIKDMFGKIHDDVLQPGIHLINPLYKVHKLSIRTQEIKETANVPSKEGLVVKLEISLLFSLDPTKATQVYKTLGPGYVTVVVEPTLRSTVRGATAGYEAKALYTSSREAIANAMSEQIKPVLAKRGISVEAILMRSIELPLILSTAIEKKLEAEQQAQQMKFVLEREEREADRKKIEARGISNFQKIVSLGISENLLRWKGIEATKELAVSNNSKVVVIGAGRDGLPIILNTNK
ncbi:prohibitin family protein [Elusimicrobiota bacterium]